MVRKWSTVPISLSYYYPTETVLKAQRLMGTART
jgi:hypothetical protein